MRGRTQTGFTIVELLIVIVVIGILAAITIVAYNGIQARAYDTRRAAEVSNVKKVLELYMLDNGVYPPACGADNAGCSLSNLTSYLVPAYTNKIPQDPQSPTLSYDYVRGSGANNSYAIKVQYQVSGTCKTGVEVNNGWWGTGVPTC
jgi:general secretion pathway protein G